MCALLTGVQTCSLPICARAALCYLHNQAEPGTSCPLTMTHAAVPVLQQAPALREWADKVAACRYDPRDVAIAGKPGVTLGMCMTEKQGGSDVRSNTTTATSPGGDEYALVGPKWRTEERRVGNECGSTWRSWWWPSN